MANLVKCALAAALAAATAAATRTGTTFSAYMSSGKTHYDAGRYQEAADQFERAAVVHDGSAGSSDVVEVNIWLGLSLAQLREFPEAASRFAAAIGQDPSSVSRLQKDEQWAYWSWTSLINAARGLYNRDEYDSSLTYSLAATRVEPSKSGAYALIANSYSALGRYDDMLATARRMLTVSADSPEAFGLIGLYFLQRPDNMWYGGMKQARWDSCGYYYQRSIEIHERRYSEARRAVSEKLGIPEGYRLDEVARNLVEKSRALSQQVLRDYIEKDLKASKQLAEVAQCASQLFYAANNLNVAASRAGSAMLRASSETEGEVSRAFRATSESLFNKALRYDPYDYTAMFNLGIAQYQDQNDLLAERTFQRVIAGTVVDLATLPAEVQATLLALITPANVAGGFLQLPDPLRAVVDSVLYAAGNPAAGFGWLYYPGLRWRKGFRAATPGDAAGISLSLESPMALENIYLLMGVTQTSLGLAREKGVKGSGRESLQRGIASLRAVIGITPSSAEAWQNLVHCYRETGQEDKALAAARNYQSVYAGRSISQAEVTAIFPNIAVASTPATKVQTPSVATTIETPFAEQPRQEPPVLSYLPVVTDANANSVLDGGERVTLAVRVSNSGEGSARGVQVKLSGTSKALTHLGTSKTIGDIPAGQTREAEFSAVLPNRIEPDNGSIIVRVTEANGFDALEEKELVVAMQPAKVERSTEVISTLVDVDIPLSPSGFRREDAYAVVIGVSEYRETGGLPSVGYARKDAEMVRDYLVAVGGFDPANIKLLVDEGALKSDIEAYVEEWLARNVRPGGFVFVYFAGHGTPNLDDSKDAFIVPYDGEPGFTSKLYPLSRLYDALEKLPAEQVVVALDACFTGTGGRSVLKSGTRPIGRVDFDAEAGALKKVAVLTAAGGSEISQDFESKKHGLFTYYLLKGMRGEADSNNDGWVTLGELHDYAAPLVRDESRRIGHEQNPQLLPEGGKPGTRIAKVR